MISIRPVYYGGFKLYLYIWYEQVEFIMRNDPARFFLFSPQTKLALSVYLDLKQKAEEKRAA